jgi:hypothetical protein
MGLWDYEIMADGVAFTMVLGRLSFDDYMY